MSIPAQITIQQWDSHYLSLCQEGLDEPFFGETLSRYIDDGDTRLRHLKFDNSPAALMLWNMLLSENQRLKRYKADGKKIIAAMKDLGTIPVIVLSFENMVAFYPDGAWWTPCLMEHNEGLFQLAAQYGLDDSYCPVRAMLSAFINMEHFPAPDKIICSTGAVCDDFSAISQCLHHLGFEINYWQIPHRRHPEPNEAFDVLPGGFKAPKSQVSFVRNQLEYVCNLLQASAGQLLTNQMLANGIKKANAIRTILGQIRELSYTAQIAPMGSLEMLIAEMFSIHFCSDYAHALNVLGQLHSEIQKRVDAGIGVLPADAARIFWINPVADLRAMNLLEESGGRVCGTEYLISHAMDLIPEDIEPMEALAQIAIADTMVGSLDDRAQRIQKDIKRFGAEGVIVSRIPGASHCAYEASVIGGIIRDSTSLPVVEIEVSTICDSLEPAIRTRMEALIESIKQRRQI